MSSPKTTYLFPFVLIGCIITLGTTGYILIEGWGFLDALYMTIITLTTVGFREIHVLSDRGIVFTIVLIVGGVGTVLYALSTGARVLMEGEIQEALGRKRLEKRIRELRDHYIICGFGRMGKIISRELRENNIHFVAVEKNPEVTQEHQNILMMAGDATKDEVLKEAGIERAKGLVSVLSSDAENLFVVLTARGLNPDLFIVARAGEEGSESKLLRAGADKVVSPYHIGGLRMAYTVLKPAVVEFIEFATKSGNIDLQMEEVTIGVSSPLAGLTLDQCGIGKGLGIIIVAIKKTNGDMKFNPTFRTAVHAGDTLIALGEIAKLKVLEDMALGK